MEINHKTAFRTISSRNAELLLGCKLQSLAVACVLDLPAWYFYLFSLVVYSCPWCLSFQLCVPLMYYVGSFFALVAIIVVSL